MAIAHVKVLEGTKISHLLSLALRLSIFLSFFLSFYLYPSKKMPNKGMRHLLLRSIARSSSSPSLTSLSSSSPKESLGPGLMAEKISEVESIITKWELEGSTSGRITSLFDGNRDEARLFLRAVSDLNNFMLNLKTSTVTSSPASTTHQDLVRTHRLMETAMKRLQREFFRILSANRDHFGSTSVRSSSIAISDSDDDDRNANSSSEDDEAKLAGESLGEVERLPANAMADLRSIANCMVSAGYAKECVKIYKNTRKLIIDEGTCRLGFQRLSHSEIEKLDGASVEHWIKNWLTAARIVIKTLFSGERTLCDFVFGSSEHIKESCFAELTRDLAVHFLEFPELVAATSASKMIKRKLMKSHSHSHSHPPSPERIYRLLDLHNCITDLWPDIEKVFSYHATSSVRAQALSSLQRLGDSVRYTLADFERMIQKDTVKEPAIPGGGLHPLTCRVMDVLVLLADYSLALDDIFIDQPLPNIDIPSSSSSSSVSARFAWLVLVLLCKLDAKAELYKDMSLSYLFLANNLQYVVKRVSTTKNLRELLGEDWVKTHNEKAKSFVRSHERMGLTKMAAALEEEKIEAFAEYGQSRW